MDAETLSLGLQSLSVFRNLHKHPLIQAYRDVLDTLLILLKDSRDDYILHFADRYGALCAQIYAERDITANLLSAVHFNENALTKFLDEPCAKEFEQAVTYDIEILNQLLSLSSLDLKNTISEIPKLLQKTTLFLLNLPDFAPSAPLPFHDFETLRNFYKKNGYGFFAQATAFAAQDDGTLAPVYQPDQITLQDLHGYQRQKKQILQNTLAFLEGQSANNILLYGDKGTGKSSTVKAVVNAYALRGLKIIELSPRHIKSFPQIFETVKRAPFSFILFLDDLSFSQEDENFIALKALIEGGLAGQPSNVLIYATSNRRHMIRESMAERQGDEVRVRDTLETVTSLFDRFGLEIVFSVPDKDEYLYIVEKLAEQSDITLSTDELYLLAERFALRRNGRSPRTAQQFIRQLRSEKYNDMVQSLL